ncbi:MAG: metalloregulator ArsR/SmtB family transcription factor [Chloroflexi bacterium]|nr:metalloregulator ArsR/SmtB family transcription factor [Chloroflexota bacterium]MBU1751429.1 metalloregulator ArsR/SmtB family transcription factor [Chloroflexota bacterium]
MNIANSRQIYQQQTTLFKALAHPTRLQILDLLAHEGEACVCHLTAVLGKRQPYVSQQLMVLREAGLVDTREDGLMVYYRLRGEHGPGLRDLLAASRAMLGLPVLVPATGPAPGCTCPKCRPTP